MLFKKFTPINGKSDGCFYIPWVERPKNLAELGDNGHLWTYLTASNIYRHLYTAPDSIPKDKNGVAICFKVRLTSEQQSRLELLTTRLSASIYRGDLAFEPEAIESCILMNNEGLQEIRREVIEANTPSP
ncbi:hypothetical protein [Legionella erythra]|uniref:Uncharacterized protein n=1 Tax=Legionella erythra TaxID=448 RepID=A0A0W0TKM7_LEGER|nr:hypothetical protein [Legionella erythra]KTC96150.1 hypothetical protein Lery_1942 [Legionella erythra]